MAIGLDNGSLVFIVFGHRLRMYKIFLGLVLISGIILVVQPQFLFPDHYYPAPNTTNHNQ
jgi:hypothetical protein